MIKQDLPNMPTEVIDSWLEPLSKRELVGWPPSPDNDWKYILGRERDLSYLQALTWEKKEIEIKPDIFIKKDLETIVELFRSHVLGEWTMYSQMMTDGKERFQSCCSYLKEHGVFPLPVVLEQTNSGVHVFDGNHRICAFFYLHGYFKIENDEVPCLKVKQEQEVWLSTKI